jgi:signal transduction histidine kinase
MLRVEVKDPGANDFSKAIGFALYSNSKASVSSFKMFFDLLWNACLQNEELMRLDKMKDEFINVAAHEFKTPIQSVLGYLELARADSEYNTTDKKRGGLIDAAYRNAVRLHRLTKNLLEVTRIESHALFMNKRRFDLKKLVLGLVNGFQNNASVLSRTGESSDFTRNNFITKFSYLPNEDDLFVNADEERITEVLLNLLDNAVKFTKGGHITVTIANDKDKNQLSVSVKDTGVGVHSQIIPRLFTKFASKSSGGTGLGLFISKSIIEAHGGKIWFQENSSNRGSTFGFTIPLQEER